MIFVLVSCAEIAIKPAAKTKFEQGLILFDKGKFEDSVPHFKEAIELDHDFSKAHLYLGRSYLNMNKWLDAIPPLRAAHRLSPNQSKKEVLNLLIDAIFGAAISKLKKMDLNGSVSLFKEILELNPESDETKKKIVSAFIDAGKEMAGKGEFSRAIEAYTEVIALSPDNLDAYIGLAKAQFKSGNFLEALKMVKRAFNLDPNSSKVQSIMDMINGK
tara:strand:+ start:625 stop:1272 length:648 start_codon:yes stop_codon:yes gene_type:complete